VKELIERGKKFHVSRNFTDQDKHVWAIDVDGCMADAFGRNSPQYQDVIETIVRSSRPATVLRLDAHGYDDEFDPFGVSRPTVADDYGERLSNQLQAIEQYAKQLEVKAADEASLAPPKPPEIGAVEKVLHLIKRFSRAVSHLKERRAGREPLIIKDEYDVQYLLLPLLAVYFDDVRPEDPVPNVAGQNSRIDFVLPDEKIAVEVKMARENHRDKEIGNELIQDIARYQKRGEDVSALIAFVYDPDGSLKNPDGLEKDLSKRHNNLDVKVVVRPQR
jgi:hypothetical protein